MLRCPIDKAYIIDAIMNPAAALQSVVEDFLESLASTEDVSLADLINCVLRTCGSNDSVDGDTVVDEDGIVSHLEDFTDVLKEVCQYIEVKY